MVVAEEHQKAVKAALDGLTAERAALAKERGALSQAAARVAGVADGVKRAAAEAIPALQKAAGEAVGASVTQSLAGASVEAAKALGEIDGLDQDFGLRHCATCRMSCARREAWRDHGQ